MASGVEFLMKSLGLDPEEIKSSIAGFSGMLVEFNERMKRVEAALERIEIALQYDRPSAEVVLFPNPDAYSGGTAGNDDPPEAA